MKRFVLAAVVAMSGASVGFGAEPVALTVHAEKAVKRVEVGIYGQFLEHIFNSVHGGLWGGDSDLIIPGCGDSSRPKFWR